MSPMRATIRLLCLATAALLAVVRAASPEDLAKRPAEWFRSAEGKATVDHVLSWQSTEGSWPKNQDNTVKPGPSDRSKIKGTFDNGATIGELRLLAAAVRATADTRCEKAFLAGLNHILKAQYPNGGWPQFYPPGKQYHRHITFNDGSMVRLMQFTREVAESPDYRFVKPETRKAAGTAYQKALACTLKCQIIIHGKATVWCAQHDEIDLRPRPARSYELESLSGSESAGVLRFLMTIDKPTPELIRAIEGGAAWFEASKLTGIRIEKVDGDAKVIKDPSAKPLWARFYDIRTNQPFFCGRDGVKKDSIDRIEKERRNGYAWYGNWGEGVAKDFLKWKAKHRR